MNMTMCVRVCGPQCEDYKAVSGEEYLRWDAEIPAWIIQTLSGGTVGWMK